MQTETGGESCPDASSRGRARTERAGADSVPAGWAVGGNRPYLAVFKSGSCSAPETGADWQRAPTKRARGASWWPRSAPEKTDRMRVRWPGVRPRCDESGDRSQRDWIPAPWAGGPRLAASRNRACNTGACTRRSNRERPSSGAAQPTAPARARGRERRGRATGGVSYGNGMSVIDRFYFCLKGHSSNLRAHLQTQQLPPPAILNGACETCLASSLWPKAAPLARRARPLRIT